MTQNADYHPSFDLRNTHRVSGLWVNMNKAVFRSALHDRKGAGHDALIDGRGVWRRARQIQAQRGRTGRRNYTDNIKRKYNSGWLKIYPSNTEKSCQITSDVQKPFNTVTAPVTQRSMRRPMPSSRIYP